VVSGVKSSNQTIQTIKQYLWLVVAWGVKTIGLRGQAWFEEHRSRVRHRLSEMRKGSFDYSAYGKWILNPQPSTLHSQPSTLNSQPSTSPRCRIIAFYLPQFHSIPENDEWHGKGFTEWYNVTRAKPQFIGHHQPQLPIDVGFYDLSSPKVMYRQVELAKEYGVHGFCFHYYWFSGGKRLLEKPLFNWLEHRDLDLPFMLCWANENWSKLWDGGNREVLMKQNHELKDVEPFFRDVLPFLKDERYIRIDGKPHLVIYRPALFGKDVWMKFAAELRRLAVEAGLGGLFLSMVGHENFDGTASDWGFDAMVEFPPMRLMGKREYATDVPPVNPESKLLVYDMKKTLADERLIEIPDEGVPVFRGLFPGWDNTSRKAYSNASAYPMEPSTYRDWLKRLIAWEEKHVAADRRYVFVNAWNEWAEGAHLEPDDRFGYGFLEATKEALG